MDYDAGITRDDGRYRDPRTRQCFDDFDDDDVFELDALGMRAFRQLYEPEELESIANEMRTVIRRNVK